MKSKCSNFKKKLVQTAEYSKIVSSCTSFHNNSKKNLLAIFQDYQRIISSCISSNSAAYLTHFVGKCAVRCKIGRTAAAFSCAQNRRTLTRAMHV